MPDLDPTQLPRPIYPTSVPPVPSAPAAPAAPVPPVPAPPAAPAAPAAAAPTASAPRIKASALKALPKQTIAGLLAGVVVLGAFGIKSLSGSGDGAGAKDRPAVTRTTNEGADPDIDPVVDGGTDGDDAESQIAAGMAVYGLEDSASCLAESDASDAVVASLGNQYLAADDADGVAQALAYCVGTDAMGDMLLTQLEAQDTTGQITSCWSNILAMATESDVVTVFALALAGDFDGVASFVSPALATC